VQQRTAEQLFRTLGELKGGAMKFGQALSVLEAALPEEMSAPYREHLTALQDSAPPMPTQTVRQQLTEHLGADWRERLVWLDGSPTAAASIGQVHRGRWRHADGTETEVAVKVQYPGAGEALLGDLRQLSRVARSVAPVFPGIDIKAVLAEIQARAAEELDYTLEAEAQAAYAEAFRDDAHIVVPGVVAVGGEVLVTEWMESSHSIAHVIREGTQEERDHYGQLFVRFLLEGPARTGMLHADPHPGNFRVLGDDGRLGVLDFGAVARLPEGRLPDAMGRLIRVALESDPETLVAGLRAEGFIKDRITVDPVLVRDYLAPFVEPALEDTFRFNRDWMRTQFERVNDPRNPSFAVATRLNLPPSYVLIHRTWLGGIGLLCQLGAEAPFRSILEESLPGFAES
jgi:predicted unusual protein kinase regulating ubiquinone biosynthesis (AarF/ABC1/UbiB family)